ncbi:MAG: hypothetical protein MUO72_11100 [Bacteroidales bacterium]|nr:hypothetical protein [Bacteroidales bacterium]
MFAYHAWNIHGGEKPKGARLIQQLFLNFLGSFVGWVMLWIVLPNLIKSVGSPSLEKFTATDILLIIVAFIGITGYLPAALVRLAMNLKDFIKLPTQNP